MAPGMCRKRWSSTPHAVQRHLHVIKAAVSLLLFLCTISSAQYMSDELAPAPQLVCPTRSCLPEDTAQRVATKARKSTKLCYTSTGTAETFARCPGGVNKCVKCSKEPPCESWCEEDNYTPKELGEPCHFDRECGIGGFEACQLGLCRLVVWTGQKCDPSDVHSMCQFGAQACVKGRCAGLGQNQPCWDGYPDGRDLDCRIGWYCLRGFCVPQLPPGHTCYSEHSDECIRGYRCNQPGKGRRPQCTQEYSLKIGMTTSSALFCETSHMSPRTGECAPVPPASEFGKDCNNDEDCARSDNSPGHCACKQWWTGYGAPGYCEMIIPERKKPSFMEFWQLRRMKCHHSWPAERCALELGEHALYLRVREESQASADPTLIEECAYDVLDVVKSQASFMHYRAFVWLLVVATSDCLYEALYA